MKVVFSSLAAYGHLYPLMPLALAFAEAGHDVKIATGEPFIDRLPLPTMRNVPEGTDFDVFGPETARRHPELAATPVDFAAAMFGEVCSEYTTPVLLDAFERDRPDLVVRTVMDIGAAIAADALGIPAVAFGLGQFLPPLKQFHDVAISHHRHRWPGQPPALLGDYIDTMPPSLQVPVPGARIAIRSVAWSESRPVPEWLTSRTGRPRVYITLGTVVYGAVDVLRRAILETAQHDVDVLVTVGPEGDPALLGELPSTVHVERFVSQADVLPHVDLVVHHGGSGTMLGALSHGLPQLILPQGADQFFNADAMTRLQAGRGLLNDDQVPGAISAAVGDLLTEGPERLTAKRLAAEIASMPAPRDVVKILASRLS